MAAQRRRAAQTLDEATLVHAVAQLRARDATLDAIVREHGLPPFWRRPPGWRTLVHIILEQQVSLASARASFARLERGIRPFTAARLARAEVGELRALGITRQKAGYCIGVACAVVEGRFAANRMARLGDDEVRAELCQLKGIGAWTAECYLLLALRRADVWPDGDLALRNAVARRYGVESETRRLRLTGNWRPWRSVAARLLWHDYLSGAPS